jgi:5-methyltetrahydrofolate--homocysteine methyltransferase
VLDASRSVSVAGALLSQQKEEFLSSTNEAYEKLKIEFENKKKSKEHTSYEQAVINKYKIDWNKAELVNPTFTGIKTIEEISIDKIAPFIDWTPFFIAWEMHGKFPGILKDNIIGEEATKLYDEATLMLEKIKTEKWLSAHAVIGFWQANSNEKDSVTLIDANQKEELELQFLRQQSKKAAGQPNISLADFIAPTSVNKQDHIGAFAVTIKGIEPHIQRFEKEHDDYSKIMLQALADRLAEALAEYIHKQVRVKYWGYAADEKLDNEELIRESYVGIRPAPGYPACPDHTEKNKLFHLLQASERIGIELTESLAMFPASSVCGWYFANPDSKYFGVGKIEKDQLIDYANRKGMPLEEATKWLRPILD